MKESENRIISLPKISDVRGNLSIIEQLKHVPFEIRRVYWIYDVPGGLDRGGHAYKESEEFFFRLNKDLPDFRAETAHMLFNMAGPMDPAEAGDEVFPYEEGYVIYVQLDDGSAYQISKWDLDLRGRIFVRELYESFRQKWEGAF